MAEYIDHIARLAEGCFSKRGSLLSLWQEMADNFYPERADFTAYRSLGTDFASNLTTSFPVLARRDAGDMFASMLRPNDSYWFKVVTENYEELDYDSKLWLEDASKNMWTSMYDRKSLFQRATKLGDHDYVTFGQCVISKEIDPANKWGMLFRCWHLRDMAWMEDLRGEPCPIFRKWKPTAYDLNKEFAGNVSKEVKELLRDTNKAYTEVNVLHCVVPTDLVEKKWRTPYVSLFIEQDTKHVLREEGVWTKIYTIPRWQPAHGSPYSYSPCTVAALPDARLIQQMTLVLLEAGEKAVNPPLVATQEAVRSDVHQYAGGLTWVDAEYDERLGEALRPMTINSNGIPHGMNMREDVKRAIESAFYLDKIGLPPMGIEMTAFETAQRVKEYMRKIVPLFSPIESEYNGSLCEDVFEMRMRTGAFGRAQDIPEMLRGQDVKFQFKSPLSETLDRQKVQSFNEAKQMLAEAVALDPSAPKLVKMRVAIREALEGAGVPQRWLASDEEMQAYDDAEAQKQQAAETLAMMQQGGDAALSMGKAANQFQQAGMGVV